MRTVPARYCRFVYAQAANAIARNTAATGLLSDAAIAKTIGSVRPRLWVASAAERERGAEPERQPADDEVGEHAEREHGGGERRPGPVAHERLEGGHRAGGDEDADERDAQHGTQGGQQDAVAEGRVAAEPLRVPEPVAVAEHRDPQQLRGQVSPLPAKRRHRQRRHRRRGRDRIPPHEHHGHSDARRVRKVVP